MNKTITGECLKDKSGLIQVGFFYVVALAIFLKKGSVLIIV